jgi:hypothetical protein
VAAVIAALMIEVASALAGVESAGAGAACASALLVRSPGFR